MICCVTHVMTSAVLSFLPRLWRVGRVPVRDILRGRHFYPVSRRDVRQCHRPLLASVLRTLPGGQVLSCRNIAYILVK